MREPTALLPDFDREMATTRARLEAFDANAREAPEALVAASEEELLTPWSLKKGGQVLYALPRAEVLRLFVLNHRIHRRGQLSVCLRLNDVPLPPIYGPTADTED
ncbi:MAG TPA: hypothetical protein VIL13_10950 [Longimicrobiales bacterium]